MTKPVVSVAAMMLAAEGRLHLGQPISDFIPAFANTKVFRDGVLAEPSNQPTVQDLLRHTSGLTYQSNGGAVGDLYGQAGLFSADVTNEEFANRLAALPFAHEPGRVWEYSHSTEILGRVVEVASGWPLSAVLTTRILAPLGMYDTGFFVANEARHNRIAEPLPGETVNGRGALFDPRRERAFEAGGMGLVSTGGRLRAFRAHAVGGGCFGQDHDSRQADAAFHGLRSYRPYDRHRETAGLHAGAWLWIWLRLRGAAGAGSGHFAGLGRRIPLDRCCRHRILDRSGRGSLRDPAHAGAESASAAARHGENHGLRCANRWKKLAGLRGLSDQSNSPHPSRRASRPQGEGIVAVT